MEPDTSAECELFDTLELIVEETVVIVTDADPHLNIYVSAQFEVSNMLGKEGVNLISARITTFKPHF